MKKNEKKTDVIIKVFDLNGVEKISIRCRNVEISGHVEKWGPGKADEHSWNLTADGPFGPYITR